MRLRNESAGAIAVLGVFLALAGIVAIYYLWGIGEAVLTRQRMQDGVDATALSAATVHARGMNILALINIAMATLIAILIMLRVLHTVLDAGVALALSASLFTFGGSLSAVPTLRAGAKAVRAAYTAADRNTEPLLKTLYSVAGTVRRSIPLVAQAKALQVSSEGYSPPVRGAVIFPLYSRLPIKDGDFATTCGHAADYAAEVIVFPIDALGVPQFVVDFMKGIVAKSVVKFGRYFCGKGGGRPPAVSYEVELREPRLDQAAFDACDSGSDSACQELDRRMAAVRAAYDVREGRCVSSGPAMADCEQMRAAARTRCHGSANTWSLRVTDVEQEYRLKRSTNGASYVQRGERREFNSQVIDWEREASYSIYGARPCVAGREQVAWTRWNKDVAYPLCTTDLPQEPTVFELRRRPGQVLVRQYKEITDVLDCTRTVERIVTAHGEPIASTLRHPPQEMCSCAQQGQEMFQLRAIALGESAASEAVQRSARLLAAMGRSLPELGSPLRSLLRDLGQISVAQAEYYFSGPESRSEWLWHMKWRSRMRRLRFNQDEFWRCSSRVSNDCPALTSQEIPGHIGGRLCDADCAASIRLIADLVAH